MPSTRQRRHLSPHEEGDGAGHRHRRALAQHELIAVYTSTRTRCIQTATAIALPHALPIQLVDDLVEIAFIDPAASMGMIEEEMCAPSWANGKPAISKLPLPAAERA